ncbi:Cytochrome P450 9e2 [Dufourea novaeangliae]|uniref:Cytochrome P450 9e2 n=1 Tax=Dufourea novaeangliae TaxID=178035 RepID=A0A154NXX3_DUFNO|nr:Cytochrome P450 9e2 [Dufourea novaeangliae]
MDLFTASLILFILSFLVYIYQKKQTEFFDKSGVPYVSPIPLLGNMAPVVFRRVFLGNHICDAYNRFGHLKYFGLFNLTMPVYAIRDPELIKSIAVTNFDHFTDHRNFADKNVDPTTGFTLFGLLGDHWREIRKVMTPAFNASKVKTMSKIIIDCADRYAEFLATQSKDGRVYDLSDIFSRYINDVMATCTLGLTVDSLRDMENELYLCSKKMTFWSGAATLALLLGGKHSRLMKLLGLPLFSEKVRSTFKKFINEAVVMRDEKGIHRPDMLQMIMDWRDEHGNRMTIDQITGLTIDVYLGAFDTTLNLICFAAHEIAVNPEIQAKLLSEIEQVNRKTNGVPTYESFNEMPYMDAVLDEVNRMYIGSPFTDRVCVKEFELPPAGPDLKRIRLNPGDVVWFLPSSMHQDPNYYPEPMKCKPERFLNQEVSGSYYLPFGIGPRMCIASKFAMMMVKIMMFDLLRRCTLEPSSETMIPIIFNITSAVAMPRDGFWLNIKTRKANDDVNKALNVDVDKALNGNVDKPSKGTVTTKCPKSSKSVDI